LTAVTIVKDPLLAAANVMLVFFIAVLSFAAAAFVVAAPAVTIFKRDVLSEFARNGTADAARLYPELPWVILGLAVLLALGVWFLVLLRRIVRSVGEGDPFVPVNAARLTRMGWLALAGQIASLPIGAAVVHVARMVSDSGHGEVGNDFGFSGEGVLLVLTLFILARVFRQGARMREELEGTV